MKLPKLTSGPIIPNVETIPDVRHINYEAIIKNSKSNIEEINEEFKKMADEREKRYEDEVSREKRMIELLESIDKNTSILNDIFRLLEENTKDQKMILEILNDFNSLATINKPTEAQSLYRKIINKINTCLSDVNTMTTLYSYGMLVYTSLHNIGKI